MVWAKKGLAAYFTPDQDLARVWDARAQLFNVEAGLREPVHSWTCALLQEVLTRRVVQG